MALKTELHWSHFMFPAVSILYPLEQAMPFPASIFRLLVFEVLFSVSLIFTRYCDVDVS